MGLHNNIHAYLTQRKRSFLYGVIISLLFISVLTSSYFLLQNRENKITFEIARLTENGQIDEAIAKTKERTVNHPDKPELWASLGKLQILNGNYAEAVSDLSRAIALGDNTDDYSSLAQAYLYSGQVKDASATLQKIQTRITNNYDALRMNALTSFMKGNFNSAIPFLKKMATLEVSGELDESTLRWLELDEKKNGG